MPRSRTAPVSRSLQEYGRAAIGGLIFSLPLLFTMEVWWAGFSASPERLMLGLAGTFLLLIAYNAVSGLRDYLGDSGIFCRPINKDENGEEVAVGAVAEAPGTPLYIF
jgi:hypothetical protein